MKNLMLAVIFAVFSFVSFGFISDTIADDPKSHPCPYVQKLLNSEEYSKKDIDSENNECPFLGGKKTDCPYLKGEIKGSESGTCPYSGKKDTKIIQTNNKIKLLEVKNS